MRVEVQVGEDGHVDLGPEVLERLGLRPGERATLSIDVRREDLPQHRSAEERRAAIKQLGGILHRPGMKALTQEDIDKAIGDAMTEKYMRR